MDLSLLPFRTGQWKDAVNIDFSGMSQNYDLSVYSVSGNEVYRQNTATGKGVFSLLAETYIVKAGDGQMTQFKKFILTE